MNQNTKIALAAGGGLIVVVVLYFIMGSAGGTAEATSALLVGRGLKKNMSRLKSPVN